MSARTYTVTMTDAYRDQLARQFPDLEAACYACRHVHDPASSGDCLDAACLPDCPECLDDTLGPCGCTDYHLADCPTRTGGAGMTADDYLEAWQGRDLDDPQEEWL